MKTDASLVHPARLHAVWSVAVALVAVTGCAPPPQAEPTRPHERCLTNGDGSAPETRREISFQSDGSTFDAVIDVPTEASANQWGVLLIGGGVGNDLDWSTPGVIDIEGRRTKISISGEGHADAPTLSKALTQRGFTVLRWSTIARGDPLADQWPVRATPRTPTELLSQARSALASLRNSGLVDHDRIILIGHSLGAARACTLASEDAGIRALVLLAPAYFVGTDSTPRTFTDSGLKHGAEVLLERPLPCLILLGSLDQSRAVNRDTLLSLRSSPQHPSIEIRVFDGLGHQLGPERDGRHGPIDPAVLDALADWLDTSLQLR